MPTANFPSRVMKSRNCWRFHAPIRPISSRIPVLGSIRINKTDSTVNIGFLRVSAQFPNS